MLSILMLLAACAGGEDSAKDGDPLTTGGTEGCPNEAQPEITDFTISEGDVITNEDGEEQPSIDIYVEFEDADSDLNTVSLDLWFDDAVDESVDTSGSAPITSGNVQVEDGNCSVSSAGFTLALGIVGDPLDFDTTYEFAAIAYDSNGNASAPAITSGTTPSEL